MTFFLILLIAAAVFGLCFAVDKAFSKLFRSKAQHRSGMAVRANKRYGLFGVILSVLGIMAVCVGISDGPVLLWGGVIVLLMGICLAVGKRRLHTVFPISRARSCIWCRAATSLSNCTWRTAIPSACNLPWTGSTPSLTPLSPPGACKPAGIPRAVTSTIPVRACGFPRWRISEWPMYLPSPPRNYSF